MFMFNGTDYTIYVIIAITVIFLFALQYLLCSKTRNRLLAIYALICIIAILLARLVYRNGKGEILI